MRRVDAHMCRLNEALDDLRLARDTYDVHGSRSSEWMDRAARSVRLRGRQLSLDIQVYGHVGTCPTWRFHGPWQE